MSELTNFIWNTMTARLQKDGIEVQAQQPQQRLETGWITHRKTVGRDEVELITERRLCD